MAYNPSFTRDPKGKFNPELGFVSIKGGSDAYLLEDELNELQWIQNEARANLIRQITKSGFLQIKSFSDSYIQGGLQGLGKQRLNSFLLYDFEAVMNGYLAYINSADSTGNLIILPGPPSNGSRKDFVYLEFWFQEITENSVIPKFGGINNDPVVFDIVDKRYGFKTSRRIQLQWAIRVLPGLDVDNYPNGFVDSNSNSNRSINPIGSNNNPVDQYYFKNFVGDSNLYVSGNGTVADKTTLGSADGYVYAMPLFVVNRLNNGGYHEVNNPNGGINYVDKNSVSGRPDSKFANIIYNDQVVDLRKFAYISTSQYDTIYTKITDLDNYKQWVTTNILQPLTQTQNDLFLLDDLVKNDVIKNQMPAKADITYVDAKILNLTNILSAQISAVNTKADNTEAELTSNVSRLDTSINNLNTLLNAKIDTNVSTLTTNLANLGATLDRDVNTLQTSIDNLQNNLQSQINIANSNISNAFYSFNNTANAVLELLNQTDDLNERVITIEMQLQGLGFDPVKTDTIVYGIEMQRNAVLSPGGFINANNTVNSVGVSVQTIYHDVNDYGVAFTVNNTPEGKVGDIWIEKADTSYLFKNTGYGGIKIETIVFKNDGVRAFKGSGVCSGMTGTKITRTIKDTDFIFVTLLNNAYGDIGEIYVNRQADGFTVYNTGVSGYNFEWLVIDTTQLRNIDLVNVTLAGSGGKIQAGQYGTNFNVLVSYPPKPATNNGGIGEITINRTLNSFTVYNSGSIIGSTVQCLVFKEKPV